MSTDTSLPTSSMASRRRRRLVTAACLVAALSACSTNAPDRPGAPLERDGTSPLITDPGGVANDLDDLTED